MAQVTFCDLCHEQIKDEDTMRKFKIKEVKHLVDPIDRMAWDSWVTIDAHSECVAKLLEVKRASEPES